MSAASLSAASLGFSPEQFVGIMLGSLVAPMLLAVVLPFAASLNLDAIVLVLRGRGVRGLLLAGGLTVAVAIAGATTLSLGGASTSASCAASTAFLLPWSCALAAVAFVIRQVKGAVVRRGGAPNDRRGAS